MADVLETRVLFRNLDEPGLPTISVYERLGGYRALKRAFREIEPTDLLDTLEGSGLRGRGCGARLTSDRGGPHRGHP